MIKGKKKKMTPYNQESSSAGSLNFISVLVCGKADYCSSRGIAIPKKRASNHFKFPRSASLFNQ
ncbi:hypothetical protein [Paenibacillus yonginensis]|uniref:hypothetical protein n=1 Tax=Paenibacillus yonginensis TaxID=1462996 RepID=UPI0012463FDC|nr:hypothetical protein [Paenibacillus yonginensis]